MLIQAALLALSFPQAPAAEATPKVNAESLPEARAGFTTQLVRQDRQESSLEAPPDGLFSLIHYDAPLGPTQAYVSKVAGPAPRPAIVWLTGGFPVARGGSVVWEPRGPGNEQSASAYRRAGIVMMFPTVRGTAMNPGNQEFMMGEVDDVIAAARHLATYECVDPGRIYLGGHSTGGTLALLVAESTDIFKAAFCFGPSDEFAGYGIEDPWPFDTGNPEEWRLRSPVHFLDGIKTPTFVIEGQYGSSYALRAFDAASDNPMVTNVIVPHADHFRPLDAINRLLSERIVDCGQKPFRVTGEEIVDAHRSFWSQRRRENDRRSISRAIDNGLELGALCRVSFKMGSHKRERLERGTAPLRGERFSLGPLTELIDEDGDPYFEIEASQVIHLTLENVDRLSSAAADCAGDHRLDSKRWSALAIF